MPTRGSAAPLLRFAVVGAGSISREYALQHLTRDLGATVTAVVDLDVDKAKVLATDVGSRLAGAKVSGRDYGFSVAEQRGEPVLHATSLDACILAEADAVYIGTTPGSHASLVRAALEADKHVLLEKPLAATRADADAIVLVAEAASARGVRCGMNIGMRWNEALRRMRSLAVEQNSLGPLRSARLDMHYVQWPRQWQEQPWCAKRAEGGPLREVGTHFVAALLELFGAESVARVRCALSYPDGADGVACETMCNGTLELTNGLAVSLSVLTDGSGLAADGEDHYELELCGESGDALLLDGFVELLATTRAKRKRLVRGSAYGRKECVRALVAAVREGPESAAATEGVTPRFGRNVQRVLDALLASGGEWVAVEYE
jgi:predicted dehydrogenase